MALTRDQLAKLPPSVAALLASQSQGDQQLPEQVSSGNNVLSDLQGALGRRFGETQDYDSGYDAELRGMIGQVPQLQSQYEQRRQRMGEDFTQTADSLAQQNDQARSRHLAAMADRGMGFSGANLVGQERIGEAFQKSVQGANQSYTRGLADTSTDEADAYQRIKERQASVESAAADRARVRDETRKWQAQQAEMEKQRLAQEATLADQQRQQQEQEAAAYQQQLQQLEAQSLASSQPMPTATGSMAPAASSAPSINTDTNVSVNFHEYNLRDPNEVRVLQSQLGLRPDGIIGPETIAALQTQRAVYFNDRPIDRRSRPDLMGGAPSGYQ